MRISFLFTVIVLCSCKELKTSEPNQSLNSVVQELSGKLLGKKVPYLTKKISCPEHDIIIFARHQNFILNELDLHFFTRSSSSFFAVQNYYNNLLGKEEKDKTYCSWQTDSTEFILYKNSDSSILVNIFKRN